MSNELHDKVEELVVELGVIGVAAGVLIDGRERYTFSGVTSVDNPLSVDEHTLFQVGSTKSDISQCCVAFVQRLILMHRTEVGLDPA